MTSQLRRKRQITPPNTPPREAKGLKPWAAALVLGLASWAAPLEAAEPPLAWNKPAGQAQLASHAAPVTRSVVVAKRVEQHAAPVAPAKIDVGVARPIAARPAVAPSSQGQLQWRPVRRAEALATPADAHAVHRVAAQQPFDPFGDEDLGLPQSPAAPQNELPPVDPFERFGPQTPGPEAEAPRGPQFDEMPVLPPTQEALPAPSQPQRFGPPLDQRPTPPRQSPSGEDLYYEPATPRQEVARDLEDCKIAWDKLQKKTLPSISLDIRVTGEPGADYPVECPLQAMAFDGRHWGETPFLWKASALCHKPLYFENESLERYGHDWGPFLQPVISGAHFFATLPILPYKMGLEPPNECIYALGHYRPGNCAPYMISPLGFTPRAAAAQAGAVVGAAAIIP